MTKEQAKEALYAFPKSKFDDWQDAVQLPKFADVYKLMKWAAFNHGFTIGVGPTVTVKQASDVLQALVAAKMNGVPVPSHISLHDSEQFEQYFGAGKSAMASTFFHPTTKKGQIAIRADHPYRWDINSEDHKFERAMSSHQGKTAGPWSVDTSPVGIIVHETGHIEHYNAMPVEKYAQNNKPLPPTFKALIHSEVSEYATTNTAEAVAEIYTGLTLGKKYSKTVMDIYKFFHGPKAKPL